MPLLFFRAGSEILISHESNQGEQYWGQVLVVQWPTLVPLLLAHRILKHPGPLGLQTPLRIGRLWTHGLFCPGNAFICLDLLTVL